MKQHGLSTKAVTFFMAFIAALMLVPCMAAAGQLQPTAAPAPTMHTLDEIYQQLSQTNQKLLSMQQQIIILQTTISKGNRFIDNGNGTVTDSLTGLIWFQKIIVINSDFGFPDTWAQAVAICSSLASGQEGLTDGSVAGQWRLPTIQELEGIGTNPPTTYCLDGSCNNCPVTFTTPGGNPFEPTGYPVFWSSTPFPNDTNAFFGWAYNNGYVGPVMLSGIHASPAGLWPVRNGL